MAHNLLLVYFFQVDIPEPDIICGTQKDVADAAFPFDEIKEISDTDKPRFVLKNLFGYETFRPGQEEVITNILNGTDNMALLPTGGGKSIIYSVAAVLQRGIYIVVEPLKSLMEEQVKTLREKQITSYFINGSVPGQQIDEIINILTNASTNYALLFTSPEKLQGVQLKKCLETLKLHKRVINTFVDEAHCIDLWGGSFRSACNEMGFLKTDVGVPITALSGSASDRTVDAIKTSLKMINPVITKIFFSWNNLTITALKKSPKPIAQITCLIKTNFPESCGIVYCNKRETTKDVAHTLRSEGITSTFIHGGLDESERRKNENLWKDGIVSVACCTKSFGMGINKTNVRFVYLVDMPESFFGIF